MREVEITFGEKNSLQISKDHRKFKALLARVLTWIHLVEQKDWTDLKNFADTKYSESNKDKSKIILERMLDAIPVEGRVISGNNLFRQCFPKVQDASLEEKLKKLSKEFQVIIQVIQNYLAYAELMDAKQRQKLLLKSLGRKNNYELFIEAKDKFNELLTQGPLDLMQSQDQWLLNHLHFNHTGTGDTGYAVTAFMDTVYTFETFNQLTYLSYYFESLHLNVKLQSQEQLWLQNKVEPILNDQGELAELVQLYVLAIKMRLSNELAEYAKFEKLYEKYHQKLDPITHLNFVKSMSNVFHHLFNKTGDEKIAEQHFTWMMKSWQFHLYEHQGSITEGDYLNFMIMACFFKKYELFTQFQQAHDHLLDSSIARDLKAFCKARLYFEQSQYNQSLALLNQYFPLGLTTIDTKYGLRVKGLRVMIYFEMLYKQIPIEVFDSAFKKGKIEKQDLDDLLINSMNALNQYCFRLKNNQFDEQIATGNQRFVILVGKLLEYLLVAPRVDVVEKRRQLKEEIQFLMQENRPLAYRLWLKKTFASF